MTPLTPRLEPGETPASRPDVVGRGVSLSKGGRDSLRRSLRIRVGLPDGMRQDTLTVWQADPDGRTADAHGPVSTVGTKPRRPRRRVAPDDGQAALKALEIWFRSHLARLSRAQCCDDCTQPRTVME